MFSYATLVTFSPYTISHIGTYVPPSVNKYIHSLNNFNIVFTNSARPVNTKTEELMGFLRRLLICTFLFLSHIYLPLIKIIYHLPFLFVIYTGNRWRNIYIYGTLSLCAYIICGSRTSLNRPVHIFRPHYFIGVYKLFSACFATTLE